MGELYLIGAGAFGVGMAIVHLCFALAVAVDVVKQRREGRTVFGGGVFVWFLATLLGGVFVLAAYWLMTYSMLHPRIASAILNRPRVTAKES